MYVAGQSVLASCIVINMYRKNRNGSARSDSVLCALRCLLVRALELTTFQHHMQLAHIGIAATDKKQRKSTHEHLDRDSSAEADFNQCAV